MPCVRSIRPVRDVQRDKEEGKEKTYATPHLHPQNRSRTRTPDPEDSSDSKDGRVGRAGNWREEYCRENFGLLQREIYRYINAYKLVQVTQKYLGEAPLTPKFAERVLGPVARKHPEKLKAVQAELKKRGLSVGTANTMQIGEAVKVVMPPKKKARK